MEDHKNKESSLEKELKKTLLKIEALTKDNEALKTECNTVKNERNTANAVVQKRTLFIAGLAHELRTPMNAIIGFTELLNDLDISETERVEYQKIIAEAGETMLNLIGDVIDFTKAEAGTLRMQKSDFDPKELLLSMEKIAKNEKKPDASVDIVFRTPDPNGNYNIHADQSRIQQVLTNLLTNAIKFTDEGSISFGYKKNKDGMTFYVKDTGTGIDQECQSKLFEYFAQDPTTAHKNNEGTGLGLAISKKIIEEHGGKIWVESIKGEGSTFYFTIPSQESDNEKIKIDALKIMVQNHEIEIGPELFTDDGPFKCGETLFGNIQYFIDRFQELGIDLLGKKNKDELVKIFNSIVTIWAEARDNYIKWNEQSEKDDWAEKYNDLCLEAKDKIDQFLKTIKGIKTKTEKIVE